MEEALLKVKKKTYMILSFAKFVLVYLDKNAFNVWLNPKQDSPN